MRERSLCFLKGGLALQTVNNDDTPATAVAKAVEATWCLLHTDFSAPSVNSPARPGAEAVYTRALLLA